MIGGTEQRTVDVLMNVFFVKRQNEEDRMKSCFCATEILLPPQEVPVDQRGCLACDQFTSQPAYWQQAASQVENDAILNAERFDKKAGASVRLGTLAPAFCLLNIKSRIRFEWFCRFGQPAWQQGSRQHWQALGVGRIWNRLRPVRTKIPAPAFHRRQSVPILRDI